MRRYRKAFTLLEVLIALAIVALAVTGVLKLHLMSLQTYEKNRARHMLLWAARNELEKATLHENLRSELDRDLPSVTRPQDTAWKLSRLPLQAESPLTQLEILRIRPDRDQQRTTVQLELIAPLLKYETR